MCEINNENFNKLIKLLIDIKNENIELNNNIAILQKTTQLIKNDIISIKNDIKFINNTPDSIANLSEIKYEGPDENIIKYLKYSSIQSDLEFIKEIYFNNNNINNSIKLDDNNIIFYEDEWINDENLFIDKLISKLVMYYSKVNIIDNYKNNFIEIISNQTYISKIKKKIYVNKLKKIIKKEFKKIL